MNGVPTVIALLGCPSVNIAEQELHPAKATKQKALHPPKVKINKGKAKLPIFIENDNSLPGSAQDQP